MNSYFTFQVADNETAYPPRVHFIRTMRFII